MEKFYTVRGYQRLEREKNVLTPSLEDYLEMICRTLHKHGHIRARELAEELNVKPSSVSKMLAKLSELKFIDYEKYGVIRLTEQGEQVGTYLLWRHDVIHHFFGLLAPSQSDEAFVETELAEHMLSRETVKTMELFLSFLSENPDIRQQFLSYRAARENEDTLSK